MKEICPDGEIHVRTPSGSVTFVIQWCDTEEETLERFEQRYGAGLDELLATCPIGAIITREDLEKAITKTMEESNGESLGFTDGNDGIDGI